MDQHVIIYVEDLREAQANSNPQVYKKYGKIKECKENQADA